MRLLRALTPCLIFQLSGVVLGADTFSKQQRVDFFRDVSSRNLQGLAVRSDGRLISGPLLDPLSLELGVDLVWDIEPHGINQWLVATGPDGRILEISIDPADHKISSRIWAALGTGQVFKLLSLPDGRVVAGTSPHGQVYLLSHDGVKLARVNIDCDSVFDILPWNDSREVLVATGNPGKIMRLDLARLVASEISAETAPDAAPTENSPESISLADRGVFTFGEIRDRNVRTLAVTPAGQVLAGSAPSGNLYRFEPTGGAPYILFDYDQAEVTDIHVEDSGDVYASVVYSATPEKSRIVTTVKTSSSEGQTSPPSPATPRPIMETPPTEKFEGRSSLLKLAKGNGIPETMASRAGVAFYRIEARGEVLLLAGGDDGEMLGYDIAARRSLTFSGSSSAQLSDITPIDGTDRYWVLTNNPAGLSELNFETKGSRNVETDRIDLRELTSIGALRLNRIRAISPAELEIRIKTNRGQDEVEGWSPWTDIHYLHGGWQAEELSGQYVKFSLTIPEPKDAQIQIDSGLLYHLPQNHRPSLQAFQVITPNFGIQPRADTSASPTLTLGQVIGVSPKSSDETTRAKANLLASQIIPQPGAQLVTWSINDPDGDSLLASFSVRPENSDQWIDLVRNSNQPWVQFDRSSLADGTYFTRLVVTESAPRPIEQRLEVIFETDDLLVDKSPPRIDEVKIFRRQGDLIVEVTGSDDRSLLLGVDLLLNNSFAYECTQTSDGILDEQNEQFVATISAVDAAQATSVQVKLHDASGNSIALRMPISAEIN